MRHHVDRWHGCAGQRAGRGAGAPDSGPGGAGGRGGAEDQPPMPFNNSSATISRWIWLVPS
jgi:hypothetical protein